MDSEQERLLNLLHSNKISSDEYKLLSNALNKKSRISTIYNHIINPFRTIAGVRALIWGIVVILIMSYLAVRIPIHFPGLLNYAINPNINKIKINFCIIFGQNIVSCLILSMVFFISAKIIRQKNLRIIDFLGMVLLSRYAYLTITIIFFITNKINNNIFIAKQAPFVYSMFIMLVVFTGVIWQMVLFFSAFKESSGITGTKLWISFIISMIISTALSNYLISEYLSVAI